jgi:hypothetical protein
MKTQEGRKISAKAMEEIRIHALTPFPLQKGVRYGYSSMPHGFRLFL